MELLEATKKIQADKALTKRFSKDPTAVLKELGVDTSNLKINPVKSGELNDDDLENVAGGTSVCVSVGCIACASVGS